MMFGRENRGRVEPRLFLFSDQFCHLQYNFRKCACVYMYIYIIHIILVYAVQYTRIVCAYFLCMLHHVPTIGLFFLAELLHQFTFLPFLSRKEEEGRDKLIQKFSQKEQASYLLLTSMVHYKWRFPSEFGLHSPSILSDVWVVAINRTIVEREFRA